MKWIWTDSCDAVKRHTACGIGTNIPNLNLLPVFCDMCWHNLTYNIHSNCTEHNYNVIKKRKFGLCCLPALKHKAVGSFGCLCVCVCIHLTCTPECESRNTDDLWWLIVTMVLSLPFLGEQGSRLYSTRDFSFSIKKANQVPVHNSPPLLSLSSSMTEPNHTTPQQTPHTSAHFSTPCPYLRLCDIQYASNIKTWTYADEMKGTISQTQ